VGLIGSRNIGITVAQFAIEAGRQVVLSNSRGPETLTDTVAQLGRERPRRRASRLRRPVTSSWSQCPPVTERVITVG
jgi:predicted dinucleotide-binding enzyme